MDDLMGPQDASQLSAKQLTEELEKRGFKDTGFPEDNIRVLQKAFDVEWEQNRAEHEKRLAEAKQRMKKEEEELRKRRMLERQRAEEAEAVKADPRVKFWMGLVRSNTTPEEMSLRVDPVAVRAFVKAVGDNTSLRGLDLTRCNLKDDVGVELAKSLQRNTTLRRLDLDNNSFGPMTVASLSEALMQNTTLESLSLERNPLTNKGTNFYGLESLSQVLATNTTLTSLNLFACGLASDGGRALARAMETNRTLLRLQLATTDDLDLRDLQTIAECLTRNKDAVMEAAESAEQKRRLDFLETSEKTLIAEEVAKEEAERAWMEAQKLQRARERREREAAAAKKEEEDRVAREVAELERLEAMRAAEAAKKKKGRKGKGKKK